MAACDTARESGSPCCEPMKRSTDCRAQQDDAKSKHTDDTVHMSTEAVKAYRSVGHLKLPLDDLQHQVYRMGVASGQHRSCNQHAHVYYRVRIAKSYELKKMLSPVSAPMTRHIIYRKIVTGAASSMSIVPADYGHIVKRFAWKSRATRRSARRYLLRVLVGDRLRHLLLFSFSSPSSPFKTIQTGVDKATGADAPMLSYSCDVATSAASA